MLEIDENINPCRGCPDYDEDGCKSNGGCGRPQTRADHIRSMSDEKLAHILCLTAKGGIIGQRSETEWLTWLKRGAE